MADKFFNREKLKKFTAAAKSFFKLCGRFFRMLGKLIARAWKPVWELMCRNKSFARFAYVTFPARKKRAVSFIKRNRYKIIIPAAVCVILVIVLLGATVKDTIDSGYYPEGIETSDFGMVLQHYSTFDHSEKTHIAVALSWDDGALSLQDGMAVSKIKAKVFPVNLEDKEIDWSSSDESIASVDENGRIEATEPGSVEITARLVNHNRVSKARLMIRQPVTGILIPTSSITMYEGGSARRADVRIFPENATNKNVTWQSADTKVARVDEDGTIRAAGVGMTEIKAVTEDGGYEGRCFVTVVKPSVDVEEILLRNGDDMVIKPGESINAIITVSPSNARNKILSWSSDNEQIASVSQTGRIKGEGAGITNVTVRSVNGIKVTFPVEVIAEPEPEEESAPVPQPETESRPEQGSVTYTSYDISLQQAVNMQMNQDPPLKIWKGGGHVTADESEVYEYMDPNSFYEDAYKYQFLDLSKPSGVSAEQLNDFLADKGVMRGMGQVFIDAANEYGVNEVYLIAHACLESGNGTSQLSTGVAVDGVMVYNMFGIGAYDNSALASGSRRAYDEGWYSVESAIKGGAKWISKYYINSEDGRQNTLYKMLWNPEHPVEHQYATDVGWAIKQAVNIEKIFASFHDASLSYDVPVYSGLIPPTLNVD